MRKSVLLALVLVLAIAGSSFAAELTWGGKFTADAEYKSNWVADDDAKLFGSYTTKPELTLSLEAKDGEVWDLNAEVKVGGDAAELGKYRLNVNDDLFKATAWGNYRSGNIGHRGDALTFLRVDGRNAAATPKIRLTSDALGVDLLTQFEEDNLYVLGEADLDVAKVGAAFELGLKDEVNRYSVYGGAEVDIVKVDGVFAGQIEDPAKDDNTAFGVKVSADVIEQLNVAGSFRSVGENFEADDSKSGYDVGATYTEGLLQGKVKYDVATKPEPAKDVTVITVGATYRGSEDNVKFDDLFKADHYYKNVAFAFAGEYKQSDENDKPASTIELKATTPVVEDKLWVNAAVKLESNDEGFAVKIAETDRVTKSAMGLTVNGYARVGEKLVLKPVVGYGSYSELGGVSDDSASTLKTELGATYTVVEDVEVTAKIGQETADTSIGGVSSKEANRYNSVGLSVKF